MLDERIEQRRERFKIDPIALAEKLGLRKDDYTIADDIVSLKPETFEVIAKYFGIRYPKLAEEFRLKGWRWVKNGQGER